MKNYINWFLIILMSLAGHSLFGQIKFIGEPENVENLNTADGENYLAINHHSKEISFTVERLEGDNVDTEEGVLYTEISGETWKVRRHFDWANRKGMFSPIGYDEEGNHYFSQVSYSKGVYSGRVSMFLANGGVSHVEIPYLKNKSEHQSGCLSHDGEYMILSLESNNTYGVEDLFLVRKDRDGAWKSPINMGGQINTAYQEITPFLAEDNRTLFFATNGRGGEGSFDLFYSVRLDESWRKWSEPVNLGSAVNTTGAETSFVFAKGDDWAYFVSSQNSDGYGDIKRIKINKNIEEDSVKQERIVINETPGETTVRVVDKLTGETIPSSLIYQGANLNLPNGLMIVDSLLMAQVEFEIKSQGHLPRIISTDSIRENSVNEFFLEPVTIGSVVTLKSVLFERGTAKMIEGSGKELDLVVEMMNDNPNMKILLKGHTDNQGDRVLNVRLSEGRVKSVRKYLTGKGISPYRIRGIGYGGNSPIASNATEETRKLNRRVEFEVIDN